MPAFPRMGGRKERGTALIEMALVLPFILVLTFLVIDFTRAFYAKNMLYQAAREGARMWTVAQPADSVEARMRDLLADAAMSPTSITMSAPNGANNVEVSVSAEFTWLYPGLIGFLGVGIENPTILTATNAMYNENQ